MGYIEFFTGFEFWGMGGVKPGDFARAEKHFALVYLTAARQKHRKPSVVCLFYLWYNKEDLG